MSDRRKSRAKVAVKLVLAAMVIAFVARHVVKTWLDLVDRGESPRVDLAWAGASVGLYLGGLACFGVYFWRVMNAGPSPTKLYPAVRAYLVSHLGKYVPGKAMVVVVRAALMAPFGARPATSGFATLYETLVMMAVGGLVAAAGFSGRSGPKVKLPGVGEVGAGWVLLGVGLAFLVVVWPTVFPRLASLARIPMAGVGPEAVPRFSIRLLGEGLLWSAAGWTMLGLSQVAVIRSLVPAGLSTGLWPMAVASVAMATVAGFVVPISPGGLGVREWVLWTALGSAIDQRLAVVAALVLRLSWVVGEVGAAAVLMAIRPRRAQR